MKKISIVKFSNNTVAIGDTNDNTFADYIIDIMEKKKCTVVDVSLFTNNKKQNIK